MADSAPVATCVENTTPRLLLDYSAEVTTADRHSLNSAAQLMRENARVYVAALPKDTPDRQLAVCREVHELGLIPIPHMVARNIADRTTLERMLHRLAVDAGVDRVLVLGGDRDQPAGNFHSSLQLIQSGLLQKHGIDKIAIACYPEGHPRIPDTVLDEARNRKIVAAREAGLDLILISQLCFEADPIIAFLRRLRAQGVTERVRVGIAGPATRSILLRYAAICGVGPSLRALKERQSLARNLLSNETPERIALALEAAAAKEPALGIWGVHFFTFGSLRNTIEWVARFHTPA